MTSLQAAKAHCANYQPDGSCLGVYYNDNLTPRRGKALPKCLLANCQACPYFEQIVLPQVSPSVAEQYRKSLPADAVSFVRPQRSIKLCRECKKHEVEPRKRYCPTCAKIRKRRFKREHMRRKRELDVEKQEISPIGAQALTKAKTTTDYHHPQTGIRGSTFSTTDPAANSASDSQ